MSSAYPAEEEVVICGAGIAGVSAAYFLAARQGVQRVILVDELPPLSLTSDHSTECYRNWWPDEAMVALLSRSIDLLEELAEISNNVFHLNRRGYLYCTAEAAKIPTIQQSAEAISRLGAGPLRIQRGLPSEPPYIPAQAEGYRQGLSGADLLLDPALIQQNFPGLSGSIVAALHVRRAGWFSAQQLGMYFLEQARLHGASFVSGRVVEVEKRKQRVQAVLLADGRRIETNCLVLAAGPYLPEAARMLGIDLPVYNELHLKAAINDPLGVVLRRSPLLIWTDPQELDWSEEERQAIAEDPQLTWLLQTLPSGVHTRPEGGSGSQMILMLWEYHNARVEVEFPLPTDPQYPEIALRGLSRMVPGFRGYYGKFARPRIDGGYYTRTRENRPLVGRLPVEGAYVIGALSGFGMMACCGAAELLAAYVAHGALPDYAPAFALERYQDPGYQKRLENWGESGQL
ncbi:MAG: FAD-binding oxidoreductase [Anaerolineales bacterium]|nr:FAD-binding oxidoreductase [Anaerolineales bacterium]